MSPPKVAEQVVGRVADAAADDSRVGNLARESEVAELPGVEPQQSRGLGLGDGEFAVEEGFDLFALAEDGLDDFADERFEFVGVDDEVGHEKTLGMGRAFLSRPHVPFRVR